MSNPQWMAPKGEIIRCRYRDAQENMRFIMTMKENNPECYYLYECKGKELSKLGKAKTPVDLEEKFHVDDIIKGGTK